MPDDAKGLAEYGAPWKFLQALAKPLESHQVKGCAAWGEKEDSAHVLLVQSHANE